MKKTKLNIRGKILGAVAFAAALFIGAMPITAFAGGHECTCETKCTEDCIDPDCELCKIDYTLCCGEDPEEAEPEEKPEEKWGPLTPDGNMTLVDDYGSIEAGGKQFITVVTKSGNYFYIIIDRDDQGQETVHFLNMVDESDLLSLMDEDQVKEYMASKGMTEEEPAPVVEEPKEEPEPAPEPVEPEPEKKNPASVLALVLLLGIGGAGGYMYLTRAKSKKADQVIEDPDADYDEDEDDYLNSLPGDEEDFEPQIDTEDDIPVEDPADTSEEEDV